MAAEMIRFTCQEKSQTLAPGGHFARARETGFRDTSASDHQALIAEISAGRPWREAVHARYASTRTWLHRIIADPRRTAFLDLLPARGLTLDIGSGWGQAARPLAQDRPVVALEPVAERLAFIRAAATQDHVDHNLYFLETDYFETAFDDRFAAICAIGVLEWSGAFQSQSDPQQRQREFLRKTRSELAPGGALLLGIENRLGLKYLLGCPDDHIGLPGIANLPAALARARYAANTGNALQSFTYSQAELTELLRSAGYAQIEFFGAFPDYKLPELIVPLAADGAELNQRILAHDLPAEHNGYDGSPLPSVLQEQLATQYRALAARNQAHILVPSFFVRAS